MKVSPDEFLAQLKQGLSPTQILQTLRVESGLDRVLALCKVARVFDAHLYHHLISSQSIESPDFGALVDHAEIIRSPLGCGYFRLRPDVEPSTELSDDVVQQVHRIAADHFVASTDRDFLAEAVYHAIGADPGSGLELFEKRFQEANSAFALSRCRDLLQAAMIQAGILTPEQIEELHRKSRLIDVRELFADDFYRTLRYLQRTKLEDQFAEFLRSDRWLLEIQARGGMGKTMFLRWLVSRRLVPDGTPCARINFDDFRLDAGTPDWMLLLRFAGQLDVQLPGSPLQSYSMQSAELERMYEDASQRPAAEKRGAGLAPELPRHIALALRDSGHDHAYLIIDTTEEALLRKLVDLPQFLSAFAQVRESFPGLRFVIAGRHSMAQFGLQIPDDVRTGMQVIRVESFTDDETEKYLKQRGVTVSAEMTNALQEKSQGFPIKLSLLVDLLQADTGLTEKDILRNQDIELVYLIERVVARLPDARMRWLLRYGVVPRQLTFCFAQEVLLRFLASGLSGDVTLDDPELDLESVQGSLRREGLYTGKRGQKFGPRVLKKLWHGLQEYVSESSWIRPSADDPELLVINPEVRRPMRDALGRHKVLPQIHIAAAAYFEGLVRTEPHSHLAHRINALYHHLQSDAVKGESYFTNQLKELTDRNERHRFCDSLQGPDYQDDGIILTAAHGGPLLSSKLQADALFEVAWNTYEPRDLHNPHARCFHIYDGALKLSRDTADFRLDPNRSRILEFSRRGSGDASPAELLDLIRLEMQHESDRIIALATAVEALRDQSGTVWRSVLEALGSAVSGINSSHAPALFTEILEFLASRGVVQLAASAIRDAAESTWASNPRIAAGVLLRAGLSSSVRKIASELVDRSAAYLVGLAAHLQLLQLSDQSAEDLAQHSGLTVGRYARAVERTELAARVLSESASQAANQGDWQDYLRCRMEHHTLTESRLPQSIFRASTEAPRATEWNDTLSRLYEARISGVVHGVSQVDPEPLEAIDRLLEQPAPQDIKVRVIVEAMLVSSSESEASLADMLVSHLGQIDNPVARIHAVERLSEFTPRTHLPEPLCDELRELFPTEQQGPHLTRINDKDWAVYRFRVAEILRVIGRHREARDLLRQVHRERDSVSPLFLRQYLQAADRLRNVFGAPSQEPDGFEEARDQLKHWPELHAALVVEQLERLVAARQEPPASLLDEADALVHQLTHAGVWRPRLEAVRYAISHDPAVAVNAQALWNAIGFETDLPGLAQATEAHTPRSGPFRHRTLTVRHMVGRDALSLHSDENEPLATASTSGLSMIRKDVQRLAKSVEEVLFIHGAPESIFGDVWQFGDAIQGFTQTTNAAIDIRWDSLFGNHAAIPWELMKLLAGAYPLSASKSIRHFYRSGKDHDYQIAREAHQAALAHWLGGRVAPEGLVPRFQDSVSKTPCRKLLVEPPSKLQVRHQVGYQAFGTYVDKMAGGDLQAFQIGRMEQWQGTWEQIRRYCPEVIYICMPFNDYRKRAAIDFMDYELEPAYASALGGLFRDWPDTVPLPGVVIDAPYQRNPHQACLQMCLRNSFAAELFSETDVPFVLATGFAGPDIMYEHLERLFAAINERRTAGQILNAVQHEPGADDLDILAAYGSVLYTHDPDIFTVPSRSNP